MSKLSRDPALYLTLVATAVRLGAAFFFHITDGQQAVLNAAATAIAGLIVAFIVVKDGQVAAILGVAQALLALAVGFGLHVSAENQAVIMSFVGALVAAFVRTQVVAPVSAAGRQAGHRVKPSIGRVVHYTSYGTPGGEYSSQCRAAIVTEVIPITGEEARWPR
jgi:hypothetical protein